MTWQLPLDRFPDNLLNQEPTWLQAMKGCPQDPRHHAEGDVYTHVERVCRELIKLPAYQALDKPGKQILAWSAALHDVAKPQCTVQLPEGRIASPGHAAKGADMARRLLWKLDCPFSVREQICGLVHYHMKVFWALEEDRPERLARRISLRCRCSDLAILAEADARGRICHDLAGLLDNVALFRQLAEEADCLHTPCHFASPLGRYQYLQGKWHNPELAPYEDFACKVIVMSGLPGSGKDTWIEKQGPDWPVVSLDAIRSSMRISPGSNQGRVVEAAREKARGYLRKKQNFIWNATNLSRLMRSKSLSLFLEYGAGVKIVYLERSPDILERQNSQREKAVPWRAVESMLTRWQLPTQEEAHQVEYLVNGRASYPLPELLP